jgi:hypothetical protein
MNCTGSLLTVSQGALPAICRCPPFVMVSGGALRAPESNHRRYLATATLWFDSP